MGSKVRLNLFVYTASNPVNHKDPSGLDMGVPVDPFNRRNIGGCIECDWGSLGECLWNIGYDPEQGMACAACFLEPNPVSCGGCFLPAVPDVMECFEKNCVSKKPDECGRCP